MIGCMATQDPLPTEPDDKPELLIKLQERKVRHKQRDIFHRVAVVVSAACSSARAS